MNDKDVTEFTTNRNLQLPQNPFCPTDGNELLEEHVLYSLMIFGMKINVSILINSMIPVILEFVPYCQIQCLKGPDPKIHPKSVFRKCCLDSRMAEHPY